MKTTNALKVTTPSDLEIVMTRVFHAPRQLVWKAMTTPEYLKQWMFTPPGWTWSVCKMDVTVGGKFRWEWNGPDGRRALSIWGEHRVVEPPARIVHTECMEMGPGAGSCGPEGQCGEPWELLATIDLREDRGTTLLTMTLVFPSKHARDGALASGMEQGVGAGYDRLDDILALPLKGS